MTAIFRYAVDRRATDYESWTVIPEVLNDKIPPVYGGNKEKDLPVNYGDKINLRIMELGKSYTRIM
ncbi:34231_t:CDS:2, partial [Gigaspora margarita]